MYLKRELEENQKVLNAILEEKSYSLSYAYKRLQEEMQNLENILNNIDLGIALIDFQGRIIKTNQAFCNLLKSPIEFIYNQNFYHLMEKYLDPSEKRKLWEDKDSNIEIKASIEGKEAFFQIKRISLNPFHTLMILRDITTQKKWEEEITRYTQLETLRIIASGLAHDLNNLLSAILNNLELLLLPQPPLNREPPSVLLREKLFNLKKICLRAKSLTQELLIYGKSLILSPETTSLLDFIKEVASFSLAGSGITVSYSFEPGLDYVRFDKNLLGIALHNIILNARQAMNDRGNLSIGIEREKAHGGKIELESSPGSGTTVKLYLPFLPDKSKEREPIPSPSESLSFTQEFPPKRILLMDDEADIRDSLRELLEHFGYQVITCENGEKAIEIYKAQGPFDIVILDLTVPGKYDGAQTLLELRKIDPSVKAILATGYAYKRETLNPEEYGFKGVLIKPFTLENLLELLNKISSYRHTHS